MYQIGSQICLNQSVAWIKGDPNDPSCSQVGKVWYFAADANGNRISGYYNTPEEVHRAMGGLPSFTAETLQLAAKADYLNRNTGVWMSEEAGQAELAETAAEITAYNNTLERMAAPAVNTIKTTAGKIPNVLWFVVGVVILLTLIFKRR